MLNEYLSYLQEATNELYGYHFELRRRIKQIEKDMKKGLRRDCNNVKDRLDAEGCIIAWKANTCIRVKAFIKNFYMKQCKYTNEKESTCVEQSKELIAKWDKKYKKLVHRIADNQEASYKRDKKRKEKAKKKQNKKGWFK